jgi:hypothetical protein
MYVLLTGVFIYTILNLQMYMFIYDNDDSYLIH